MLAENWHHRCERKGAIVTEYYGPSRQIDLLTVVSSLS